MSKRVIKVFALWILMMSAALAAETPMQDALAWNFKDNSELQPAEGVRSGVALAGAEREASLARGGDGFAAEFTGKGGFQVKTSVPFNPEAMTWAVRVKATKGGGLLQTPAFSLVVHSSGILIALVGVKDAAGTLVREIPLFPLALEQWYDVIVRLDGDVLEFIRNGSSFCRVKLKGQLAWLFKEPVRIGAWNLQWPGEADIPQHATNWLYQRNFMGQIDHVAVWNRVLNDAEVCALCGTQKLTNTQELVRVSEALECLRAYRDFHDASRAKDIAECEKLGKQMREFMSRDPRRPIYHLTAPMDGLFDPAGAFYYEGKYHVFSYRGMVSILACCPLAHYVSDDLIHWRDEPIAIWADSPVDVKGIWLANLFLDEHAKPAMTYTALSEHGKYGALARSSDGVVSFGEKQTVMNGFYHHDGHTWKSGDQWYSITVHQYWGKRPDKGDAIHLLSSPDLKTWTDRGEFFSVPKIESKEFNKTNGVAEFPYLLKFGDKVVLMIGTRPVKYWIGRFDASKPAFIPDEPEGRLLDSLNPFHCFNPSIVDHKGANGAERRVVLAMDTATSGQVEGIPWYGVHVLPRTLTCDGKRLLQEPVKEAESLRGKHTQLGPLAIKASESGYIKELAGDALELRAEFAPGTAKRLGLKVRVSQDGKKFAKLYFDTASGELGVEGNVKLALTLPELGHAPVYLNAGDPIRIRVFLDRSLLEVFVNGQTFTGIFTSDLKDLGLDLFSEGGDAQLTSLDVWEMKSAFGE